MSYSDRKGKYQKAYNFLYDKLVPPSGRAMNSLGEALRFVTKVYHRKDNDGDTALMWACNKKLSGVALQLINKGPHVILI